MHTEGKGVEIATQKADEGNILQRYGNGYSELNSDIMQTIELIKSLKLKQRTTF